MSREEDAMRESSKRFDKFSDIRPFYLSERTNGMGQWLDLAGRRPVLRCTRAAFSAHGFRRLATGVAAGCARARGNPLAFEKRRAATARDLPYRLLGEWLMGKNILAGKIRF
jgi:hypothetical protein